MNNPTTTTMQTLSNFIAETAAGKFLPAANTGYKKLLKVKKAGCGEAMASDYTEVCDDFEDRTVNKLVELIECEILSLQTFLDDISELKSATGKFKVVIVPSSDDEQAFLNAGTFNQAKSLAKGKSDVSVHEFKTEELREAFLKGYGSGCGYLGGGMFFKN